MAKGKKGSTAAVAQAKEEIVIPEPDAREKYLEKLVFGDQSGFEDKLRRSESLYDEFSDDEGRSGRGGAKLFGASDSESDDEFLDRMEGKEEADDGSDSSDDSSESDDDLARLNDDQLFMVDDNAESGSEMDVDMDASDSDENSADSDETDDTSDAWVDSDDERLQVSVLSSDRLKKLRKTEAEEQLAGKRYVARLRAQFERIFPRPEWADNYGEEDEDGSSDGEAVDEEGEEDRENGFDSVGASGTTTTITASSNPLMDYLRTNQTYELQNNNLKLLSPERIDISRLTDANAKRVSKSAVQTVCFHETHPLLLTGGYDRTLRVFQIDGKHNNMVTSLHLRNSPVQNASFRHGPNTEIFAAGRRRYMYKWSVNAGTIEKITRLYGHEKTQRSFENFKLSPDGEFVALQGNAGWVNVLSARTGQWVRGFKVEGELVDFDFGKLGTKTQQTKLLIVINKAGEIWEFDLGTGKILTRWHDAGGVGITKIRIGGYNGNNRWLAVGCNTGFVNIYDRLKDNKLVATVETLVTTISSLEFNHDGQLLCIASRDKKDALRLVHVQTGRTYKNWPTSGTPLGKVTSVAFSPRSEMLATGNEGGRVRLWRLNHY